jgi:YggT family protein
VVPWIYFVSWVIGTLNAVLGLYIWVVIISAVMTWIEPNPYNPIVRFIYAITEPVFDFVREHVPIIFGGIDFSPFAVILAIEFCQRVVLPSLQYYLIPGYS